MPTDRAGTTVPIFAETLELSISATGMNGVLENEDDVDRYLGALRTALVQALNDDKRIAL